ncbi:hypothetical protein CSPX01_06807 [Colletotrichum filicis]|nr:hypothetical protein CSPX01_06807 [Colletotrichum filicis]
MAGNGVGGAAPVPVLGSGILGVFWIARLPAPFVPISWLGGLSIPCPPLSAVGKQLRQGVWPDPLVAGFVKAHRSPEQRDALYGLEWWVHELQSLLYVEPFLLEGCFIRVCTCLR